MHQFSIGPILGQIFVASINIQLIIPLLYNQYYCCARYRKLLHSTSNKYYAELRSCEIPLRPEEIGISFSGFLFEFVVPEPFALLKESGFGGVGHSC